MRTLWLVPRIFATSLGAGWLLSLGCLTLCAQLGAGYLPLFLLWTIVAFARWYYALTNNKSAFAYLHNLVHSRARLWTIICGFELSPWLIALVLTSLLHALGY